MLIRLALAAGAFLSAAAPAFAHLDPSEHGSFFSGLSHPLFGLDHVLAMLTVGLWAAMLGGRAVWLVPAAFVTTMAAGFVMAMAGVGLPFVEPAILASVVILGLVVAAAVRLPAVAGAALVGVFALFHGHAHGGEIGAAAALPYLGGFAIATALLHAIGLAAGLELGSKAGRLTARALGAAAALGGLVLALG